jgi:DNA (cytosine-5)-methyltransferase 1
MKVLDLFSGIGGFSVGMEKAGATTVGFAEVDPKCSKVLEKNWPGVINYGDIHSLRGFPVSGFKSSGEKEWFEGSEVEPRLQPDWIVIENTGHRWRSWVPELRRELHGLGYYSLPIRVRADWLGYSHRRARVYLVANANSEFLRELSRWWCGEGRQVAEELTRARDKTPRGLGADDGLPDWPHRRKQLGNAVMPIFPELIGTAIKTIELNRISYKDSN